MSRLHPHAHAAAVWAFRARAEIDAASRFASIGARLERVDARPEVIRLAHEAATDEGRHHAMCVELAERFGADVGPVHAEPAQPLACGAPTERAQVLYEVVAMSCITETLSAALLGQMRERARDPSVRSVVHQILKDEIRHARLGWAHLAAEARRSSVAALGPAIPAMLAATVHEEIFGPDAPHAADDAVAGLGCLDRTARRQTFVATMRDVVFPGLRSHGIDTRLADRWLQTKLGPDREAVV